MGFANNVIKRIQRFNGQNKDKLLEYTKKMNAQKREDQMPDTLDIDTCKESLKILLEKLPPAKRRVMEVVIFRNKTKTDICKQFNYKSMNVLYSVLSQSRKKLLELIDNSPNHSILKKFINNTSKKDGKR